MAEVIRDNGWEQWSADVFGRLFGLDLFDLEKVTQIPRSLLEELSWEQGQDADFFSDGEFKGWPLRIWPIFKRPFVKLNKRYYCFDLYSFLDNFYRVLQKKVIDLNKDYQAEWNQKQKDISELLPFKYLQKLLPSAQVYHSVYYRWHTGDAGSKQWCEADGLLIYDDHLFIIEVKAGAFTYTSPANDFPAYIESIKNLILKPSVQGKRFIEYLNSDATVAIFDKNHNQIGELSNADFRQITICPISLDTFTELASQVQHLKPLGIDIGNSSVWSISIEDLRVYSDIFDNPLIFLHFLEQRMRAFGSDIIQTDDELDHVGLYIKHNIYTKYAQKMRLDTGAQLNFVGYRSDIDKFFTEKLHEPGTPSPLKQEMPARLVEIINVLSTGSKSGRAGVASYLLDCNNTWRNNITDGIEKTLSNQKAQMKPLPLSTYGDIKLTIFCWQKSFLPRDEELAIDHSRAAMLVTGDKERLMIELLYTDEGKLEDVIWTNVTLSNIPDSDMERLMSIATTLKNRRLAKAGKIGLNAPCPCGSRKKYKECCFQQ
ncbi:MAG: preprotein translocase subunit SecA [Planctomycetes bacterium]|nr:preprotein translocase subunit SecA [Planctomycetota bacterium]